MNIVVIAPYPPFIAPEADHALHLCDQLAEQGHQVHVITLQGSIQGHRPAILVHSSLRDWGWDDFQPLVQKIKECRPEAVLLHYIHWIYHFHPMIRILATAVKAVMPQVPFVTLFSNVYDFDVYAVPHEIKLVADGVCETIDPAHSLYTYGTLLRDSDRVLVVSDWMVGALEMHAPGLRAKALVAPPPVIMVMAQGDPEATRREVRAELGLKPQEFLIAYFGYLYAAKGVETLLRAFQRLTMTHAEVRLLLIGGTISAHRPYAEQIGRQIEELRLTDKVRATGDYAWNSDKASRWLRAADLCVLPFDAGIHLHNSSFAGAIAHGLPVLTTRGGFLESPFRHEENVYLCPPRNPVALAAALAALIAQPELRRRLAAGASRLSEEVYSWSFHLQRILEALQTPCAGPITRNLEIEYGPVK